MNKRVIVDIDVHHALKSSDELLPFCPERGTTNGKRWESFPHTIIL